MEIWQWGYNDDMCDGYTIVCWPESQNLMDVEGFQDNCYLIDDEEGLDNYGSSAYVVWNEWMREHNL